MFCSVYTGSRAPDSYLFLPARDAFEAVPQSLLARFGQLRHVMDLVLTPEGKLARLQSRVLMRALLLHGCHVQLPPRDGEQAVAAGDDASDPRARINGTVFGGRHDS